MQIKYSGCKALYVDAIWGCSSMMSAYFWLLWTPPPSLKSYLNEDSDGTYNIIYVKIYNFDVPYKITLPFLGINFDISYE